MPTDTGPARMPLDLDKHGSTESADMASAVHDLADMLTVVLGSLEQLRRQSLDERGRQQLERADRAAERAGRLAHQIRALACAAGAGAKMP